MTEIIELVFENVELEKIVILFKEILSKSTLKNYQIATDGFEHSIDFETHEKIYKYLEGSPVGSFYFNLVDACFEELTLINLGIFRYINMRINMICNCIFMKQSLCKSCQFSTCTVWQKRCPQNYLLKATFVVMNQPKIRLLDFFLVKH